jgi:hypothetical protein
MTYQWSDLLRKFAESVLEEEMRLTKVIEFERGKLMRRRLLIKRRLQRERLRACRARAKEDYGKSPTGF